MADKNGEKHVLKVKSGSFKAEGEGPTETRRVLVLAILNMVVPPLRGTVVMTSLAAAATWAIKKAFGLH
jgi:hypothetical protein